VLLQLSYMLGFAELALRPTSAAGALKIAAIGVARNLLKLIVFLVGLCFISFIAFILIAIVLGAIIGLLSLVHWSLAILATLLLYIPFLLCIYPLLFAGQYLAWKDLLGDGESPMTDTTGSSIAA
jgi:hypothetical protein